MKLPIIGAGSVSAAALLKSSRIKTSKSSICDLLKKMPAIVDKSLITKVCVDDFAFRKRYTYGTVMVDLESHRIIDIIDSRETKSVEKWLGTYPNLQVISRDGSVTRAGTDPGFLDSAGDYCLASLPENTSDIHTRPVHWLLPFQQEYRGLHLLLLLLEYPPYSKKEEQINVLPFLTLFIRKFT